jgi:hypothetical protein
VTAITGLLLFRTVAVDSFSMRLGLKKNSSFENADVLTENYAHLAI